MSSSGQKKKENKKGEQDPLKILNQTFDALKNQMKCIESKCKISHDKFKKKKMIHDQKIMKILLDGKMSLDKKNKLKFKLYKDLLKTKERGEMVKCQLEKCKTEFDHLIHIIFNAPPLVFAKNNKKSPYYKFYIKYAPLLNKKNIEYKDVKDMDIEFNKITYINKNNKS